MRWPGWAAGRAAREMETKYQVYNFRNVHRSENPGRGAGKSVDPAKIRSAISTGQIGRKGHEKNRLIFRSSGLFPTPRTHVTWGPLTGAAQPSKNRVSQDPWKVNDKIQGSWKIRKQPEEKGRPERPGAGAPRAQPSAPREAPAGLTGAGGKSGRSPRSPQQQRQAHDPRIKRSRKPLVEDALFFCRKTAHRSQMQGRTDRRRGPRAARAPGSGGPSEIGPPSEDRSGPDRGPASLALPTPPHHRRADREHTAPAYKESGRGC